MDRELIEMCKAPEIQERKPDYRDSKRVFTQILPRIKHPQNPTEICSAYHCDRGVYEDGTYIPRIEDVLEWLSGRMTQGKVMYEIIRRDEDSCLRGGIRCFMHFVHNKSWNGNAWKKS